jgi:DNA gyrase/topoisomerase IV subunit A
MVKTEKKQTAAIVRENLLEYGEYTIEDRAIADARDGLKPVQRRTLWSLHELKRHSKGIPVKCVTVVGHTLGRYHPHGDSACYGALVNMGWMRHPLIQKHGNFGIRESLLEAPPAAYRYTETRLSKFADRMFDDVDIMPLVKSFTEEHDEPFLLPARVPLLLVNGCVGVALAVATNIPPHNLGEIINAALEVLENPDCTTDDLLKHVKGPDYGSGVLLSKKDDLRKVYSTGRGRLVFSCNYHFEEGAKGKQKLVITGFNPGFDAKKLVRITDELKEAKLLESAANDEGSRKIGTRVVVGFTDPKIINDRVLPLLRSSLTYQFYALNNKKRPILYSLKELLEIFLRFRRKVEQLVLEDERVVLERKRGAEAARLIAITALPLVIKIMMEAKSEEELIEQLSTEFGFVGDVQAKVIADSSVRSLMAINREKLEKRIEEYSARIDEIEDDLTNLDRVVARRLREMLEYADKRGTRLRGGKDDLDLTVAEATYYVGVTEDAKVDSYTELPLKSRATWTYVDLVRTPGKFVTVSEDNIGQSIPISFIEKFDKSVGKVIGMASEEHTCVVVLSKSGRYVAFPPDQRRTQFPVFKELGDDELVFAGGLDEGGKLFVMCADDTQMTYTCGDLKITRPNVQPKALPGRRKVTVTSAIVIPAGTMLVDNTGVELGYADASQADHPLHAVGEQNLVVTEAGKRYLASDEETLEQLQTGAPVTAIIPLAEDK